MLQVVRSLPSILVCLITSAGSCAMFPGPAYAAGDVENGEGPDPALAPVREYPGAEYPGAMMPGKFKISVGGFFARFDTEVRLSSADLGQGTKISLEDDFGMRDEKSDFRFEGAYRFKPKHRVEFTYLSMERGSTNVLNKEFEIDGEIFEVGTIAKSDFDTTLFGFSYKYSFILTDRVDAGFSLGISTFSFDLAFVGVGNVNAPPGPATASVEASEEMIAPVPLLGLHFNYRVGRRTFFRSSWAALDISTDDWTAEFVEFIVGLDHFPWDHFGFGGALNWVDMEYVDIDPDDIFEVEYDYWGAVFYISFVF